MREQLSTVQASGLQFNLDDFIIPLPFLPPFIIPDVNPEDHIENSRYRSASLLKVIQRYGIIDSVIVTDKGSKISTRNLLWDAETGDVLVNRTQNEFNDPVFSFSYPAHWAYDGMGPAYKNIDAVLQNVNINGGKITSVNGGATDTSIVSRIFRSGDEVLITNTASMLGSQECMPRKFLRETKVSKEKRLWVVDQSKATGDSNTNLFFIDRNGIEYTGYAVNLRIIRSGRRNMSSTPVGSITSTRSPIRTLSILGHPFDLLVVDSLTGVLAANAAVMKDVWPVEDRFKKLSICDSTNKVVQTTYHPLTTALVKQLISRVENGTPSIDIDQTLLNQGLFTVSHEADKEFKGRTYYKDWYTRGIMQFDLSNIPDNAIVDSARLDLYAKRPLNLWNYVDYWATVNDAHTPKINPSELLRIIQPWDASTTMHQTDLISTQTNKVDLAASSSTCQDYHPIVTNMIQDMVSDPASNYGILFKEDSSASLVSTSDTTVRVMHMSFCGYTIGDTTNRDIIAGTCKTCTIAGLYVAYHYRWDSCYTDCRSIFDWRINPYAQGIWGNWRPLRSYTYYDRRKESDPLAPTNTRRDGEIKDFIPFWNLKGDGIVPTTNDFVWVWNSETTRYNRRGLETENHDPLGRFNSALYGYGNTLPIAIAQNSRYREMMYDGFEDYSFALDSCINDCPTPRHLDFTAYKDSIVTSVKHTGKASLRIGTGGFVSAIAKINNGADTLSPSLSFSLITHGTCVNFDSIKALSNATYPVFTPLPGKLMVISAWVKEDKDCQCTGYTGNSIDLVFYHSGSLIRTATKTPAGLIIEGWQRYDDTLLIPSNADSMVVKLKNNTTVPVYFDDLRLHPFDGNMKSFVYHPTNLRLLSELDENNYASFYEYDDEGTLIRVKKETERGIQTIRETRSALQKDNQ